MRNSSTLSSISVNNINLWAHVGVLDQERLLGQDFILDFTIWLDIENSSMNDDLKSTIDYSLGVKSLQKLSFKIDCMTIEYFSEKILDELELLYGPLPTEICLTKSSPPIDGFDGSVSITRNRNMNLV